MRRVRVIKRGKMWYVDFRHGGHRYRWSVSTKKKNAVAGGDEIERRIVTGSFDARQKPWEDPEPEPDPVTLGELCEKFLGTKDSNKPSTQDFYKHTVNAIRDYFGRRTLLADIDALACEEFMVERRKDVAPATANHSLLVLRQLFRKARKWGLVSAEPTEGLTKKREQGREVFLDRAEADRILGKCEGWLRPIVLTFLHTGARRGDLLGDRHGKPPLMWEQIDLKARLITFKNTKEGKDRHVPINSELLKVLSFMSSRRRGGPVFLDERNRPVKPGRVLEALRRAAKAAEVEKQPGVHDLRHTAASWMVQAGTPLYEVQKILGHQSIDMTQRYAHFTPDHLRDAVESLVEPARNQTGQRAG